MAKVRPRPPGNVLLPFGCAPHARRDVPLTTMTLEYAQVVKMLGNGRLEAQCFDGEKRLAHIRGKLRKKVWINQGDIILLSLRDYQDEKGDVILKYSADEARSLKAYGELPENAKINETDTYVAVLPFVLISLLTPSSCETSRIWIHKLMYISHADTATRVATTATLSLTRTVTALATRRTLTLMRSDGPNTFPFSVTLPALFKSFCVEDRRRSGFLTLVLSNL